MLNGLREIATLVAEDVNGDVAVSFPWLTVPQVLTPEHRDRLTPKIAVFGFKATFCEPHDGLTRIHLTPS